jgi:hypothetical protein
VDRDGEDEEEKEVLLLLAAMDATALAHTRSSRFIRFSSPQIIGSTGRSFSVVRNTGVPDTSPSPPPPAAKNSGRSTVSASRAIDDSPSLYVLLCTCTHHNRLKVESSLQLDRER